MEIRPATREAILQYRDQELLDYYDDCIDVFEKKIRETKQIEDLKRQYDKLFHRILVCIMLLIIPITMLVVGAISYATSYIPSDGSVSWKYAAEVVLEGTAEENHTVALAYYRTLYLRMIILGGILLIPSLIGARKVKTKFRDLARLSARLRACASRLNTEMSNPTGKLNKALIMFSSIKDVGLVKELRGIVFSGIASTHREAQQELQRRIERTEDIQLRKDIVKAIKGRNKEFADYVEQIGNIGKGPIVKLILKIMGL